MFLLPVAAREVREASRQSRTYIWRWATAGIALAFMAFIAWVTQHSNSRSRELFIAVSTVAYIYCLLAGAVRTADTLSQEKRDNTLGLLFLTDLKGWDIILGKLLSSSMNCFCGLLAMVPMLAIPMMMGGVQWSEFMRVILSLVIALLLSISWGFLISSLFRLSVVTISAALAIVILQGGGVPLLSLLLAEEFRLKSLARFVFVFSPTHCHIFAFANGGPNSMNYYWTALAINGAIALINLRLAIFFLPRFWQEVPRNKKTERWRNRFRSWRFGEAKAKKRLRTRLLNQNPFFWLANREQVSSAGLMATSVVILVIALLAGIAAGSGASRGIEEIMVAWMIALSLVHVIIAFRMAMSASYRLAEDRRSGALELLLGTEVSIKQLLRGYWMALGRQFFGPAMIVAFSGAFAMAMMLLLFSDDVHAGNIFATLRTIMTRLFESGPNEEFGIIFIVVVSIQLMLALNWIAVIWLGMWLGLREKRPGVATWITLAAVYVPPWIILIMGVFLAEESGILRNVHFSQGGPIMFGIAWFLGLSHIIFLSWWARRNLIGRFREAAADRYTGPRRFPWPKIRRVAFRFAAAGACVVLLLYGWRSIADRRGEKAWAQAQAAYPNFKLQTPEPAGTNTIPDAQNLAKAPILASISSSARSKNLITWDLSAAGAGRFSGETLMWDWTQRRKMNLTRVEEIYTNRKVLSARRDTPAKTVLAGLATYDEKLLELHEEARLRPALQYTWSIPHSHPQNFYQFYYRYSPNPNLDPRPYVRQIVETLALRTSARLETTDADTEDLFLALRLAEGVKDLPQSITQYHETLLSAIQPIYDGLAKRAWNNQQLKSIQDFFASRDFWSDFDAYREEYLRQALQESDRVIASRRGNKNDVRETWIARQMPIGFMRQWQAKTLVWGVTELPKIVDTKNRRIDAKELRDLPTKRPAPPTSRHYPDQIAAAIRSLGFMQTTADQIVIACAIEQFRNDHDGKLPRNLQDFVPKYLPSLPHDVFTGQSLTLMLFNEEQHYRIVGVGPDGQDNQGVAGQIPGSWMFWQDLTDHDWVWSSDAMDHARPARRKK